MVPVSSSRTAQRPGSEAMISEIHRQSSVGMPTTARATMPLSGCEEYAPVEVGLFAPGSAKRQFPLIPKVVRLVADRLESTGVVQPECGASLIVDDHI